MKFYTLFLSLVLVNCGTDDSSNNNVAVQPPTQVEEEEEEIVLVSGTYSYWSTSIPFNCSDGGTGSLDPEAMNVDVLFYDNNEIQISVNEEKPPYEGLYQEDGRFSATQTEEVEDMDYGRILLRRTLSGSFDAEGGWSGELDLKATFVDIDIVCDYDSTFEGELQND